MRRPIRRFGRPGLLGTMARTAVVAGTATAVVGGVQRHQQSRATEAAEAHAYEDQERRAQLQLATRQAQQAAAPALPAPAAAPDPVAALERLAALAAQGALTDAEFTAAKSKLLGLG
jgi:hypothetical protein